MLIYHLTGNDKYLRGNYEFLYVGCDFNLIYIRVISINKLDKTEKISWNLAKSTV